jgi:hypothetical protein
LVEQAEIKKFSTAVRAQIAAGYYDRLSMINKLSLVKSLVKLQVLETLRG